MLRLAIYYQVLHRNDGNPLYVWAALKRREKAGVLKVDHLNPTGDLTPFGKYDFHLDVDWGEDGLGGLLPYVPLETPHPSVLWMSDTHLGYDYRMKKALKADYVFVAQKKAVADMKRDGVKNPIWLPHAVEPLAYPKYELASKKYDTCFVGHVNSPNRVDALDRLFKEVPNFFYGQRLFEDVARKYAESKIVFNIAMKDDVNMRCFEAMASGSMLLTDRISSIEELFKDGEHCVMYDNLDDMAEKAKYYIAHDEERERIAAAGYAEVMEKHTIDHRVDKILEAIGVAKLEAKQEETCK